MLPDCPLSSELCPSTWWLLGKDGLKRSTHIGFQMSRVSCRLCVIRALWEILEEKMHISFLPYFIASLFLLNVFLPFRLSPRKTLKWATVAGRDKDMVAQRNDNGNVPVPAILGKP